MIALTLIESLLEWDTRMFLWVHQHLSTGLGEVLFPFLRNKYVWIPLYLFIVAFVALNTPKRFGWFVLFIVLQVTVADTLSSKVMKPTFQRLRPCNEPALEGQIRELVGCGSGYSFTSSHATNHFALATFLLFALGLRHRVWWVLGLLWAGAISLAQVVVGVHYPMDVTAGAILGIVIGSLMGLGYRRLIDSRQPLLS